MNHCNTCRWWLPNRPEFGLRNVALCLNEKINHVTLAELGCDFHVASDYVKVNVPQHTPNGIDMDTNGNVVDGPMEIFIVSYGTPTMRCSGQVVSDLDWLRYALRSIEKFCTGFQGVTVVHPNHETHLFAGLQALCPNVRLRLVGFDEIPGKGFLQHEIKMAEADLLAPPETKYVLLTDSDYVFRVPTRPDDYFIGNKPYYLIRSWESLMFEDPRNPGSKVISDCAQWRGPTEEQIGFITDVYAMCMNCAAMPIEFFKSYRYHVQFIQQRDFREYMLAGRNEHPATRMDWTAFGSYAHKFMHDQFAWIDVVTGVYPADRRFGYWSHGGISPEIRAGLEEYLK